MSGVLDISDNFDIFIRNVLRVWRIEQDRGEMKDKRHVEILHSYY